LSRLFNKVNANIDLSLNQNGEHEIYKIYQ